MPRDKKTEPGTDGLPDLTEREQRFVKGLARGMTKVEALRQAMDSPENRTPNSLWAEASKMAASYKIRVWMNAVADEKVQALAFTKEQHLARLRELSVKSEETGNMGAAVQAEQIAGKVQGYQVEKHEDVTPRDTDPIKELDKLEEQYGAEVAMKIAKQEGIEWKPNSASVH